MLTGKLTLIRSHWGTLRRIAGIALIWFSPLFRSGVYALVYFLTRKPAARERAARWREVWSRRAQWLGGYPDFDESGRLGRSADA